jgi:DNA invertase Pin-like site-specific DNA recombinase
MPPNSRGSRGPERLSQLGCNFAQGRCVRQERQIAAGRLSEGQHPRAGQDGRLDPYQDREIRAWARRNGHRIVGMFPEEGRSGALDLEDRAALTAAIDMIATGKGQGLVCYSLDRLAREITVQEAILAKVWEEAGGRVFTTDQDEVLRDDPDDPMRTAMRKMAGVMYELDRRLIVARLRRGRRLKAERGGFAGGGVRYGFTTERKQLVPDQAEREVASRIRRMHRSGLSIRNITDQLNAEQVPAKRGGAWHRPPSPESFRGHHERLRAPAERGVLGRPPPPDGASKDGPSGEWSGRAWWCAWRD